MIDANLLQSSLLSPPKTRDSKRERQGYFVSPENFPSSPFLIESNNLKASLENFWWMIPTLEGIIEPHRN